MPGMDRGFEKKFDTTKMSAEELKMCKEAMMPAGMDEEVKKKFDTTKTSAEELKMCKEEAKRPRGMEVQESKKKTDTTNVPAEEVKMLNAENASRPLGMDQESKKRFDTTMMSPEKLKVLNLEDAKRPPGQGLCPGGTLHQQGGPTLSKAGRYPMVLAGVAVLTGISTFLYYRTLSVEQLQGKANEAIDSIRPDTAKATADAPR